MAIQIRQHCIPAYDELSRLREVAPIPNEIDDMEQDTAGGIVKKVKAVLDSEYFKSLPSSKVIQSGGNADYWVKTYCKAELDRIWNECKDSL